MKIYEYQARSLLESYKIPVTGGGMAQTPEAALQIAGEIGGPVVVKAQVFVGGRGKAGGVKMAQSAREAQDAANAILGMDIKGYTVEKVLIAEAVTYDKELYLGVTLDRATQRVVMIASAEGGVEIEEVARTNPDAIVKVAAHPTLGLMEYQARDMAFRLGFTDSKQAVCADCAGTLSGVYG
jgi:succinyl-CoA synthetase beta subunit